MTLLSWVYSYLRAPLDDGRPLNTITTTGGGGNSGVNDPLVTNNNIQGVDTNQDDDTFVNDVVVVGVENASNTTTTSSNNNSGSGSGSSSSNGMQKQQPWYHKTTPVPFFDFSVVLFIVAVIVNIWIEDVVHRAIIAFLLTFATVHVGDLYGISSINVCIVAFFIASDVAILGFNSIIFLFLDKFHFVMNNKGREFILVVLIFMRVFLYYFERQVNPNYSEFPPQLKEAHDTIRTLRKENYTSKHELQQMNNRLKEAEYQFKSLESDYEVLESDYEVLQTQHKYLRKSNLEYRKQVTSLQDDIRYNMYKATLVHAAEDECRSKKQLQNDLDNAMSRIKKLNARNKHLEDVVVKYVLEQR